MGVPLERHFWGEKWTDGAAFLAAIRDRLQASREVRGIQVDDGWQADRDISVQIGRWSWLDLRAVVEDHGSGRLGRLGFRLRLAPLGALTLVALQVALAIGAVAAIPGGTYAAVAPALGGTGLLVVTWTWSTARTLAAATRSILQAATSCEMQPLHAAPERAMA
jgi:hypothetical protein